MNLLDFLNSPVADALGWTLLHALWQGFALVLPTAVVLHFLRSRSSALRYRIGVITLLTQLLTSLATFVVYYEPVRIYASVGAVGSISQPLPVRWQMLSQTLPWHRQVQQFLESHLSEFVFVYLIGLFIFGLRLAGGWLYLHRLSQTAVSPATKTLTTLTEQLRIALSLRAVVRVRESARITVPMVVGTLKPVLLVPVSLAAGLSLSEMEAVLAHELAHVKRHDYAVNLLQSVMEVLYFFHPALWWLSARVREEREHCCDDLAVQACGGNGRILAQALARVEELRTIHSSPTPALAMALASNRQLLLHRVRRMLGVSTRPVVSNSSLAGLTLATLLLMSISVYAVQREQSKPRISQPKPTRRHKVDSHSEYGMVDSKRVSYIIWKGQKLPASRVATLQRQLDQVMAGQLSLDVVKQPNRDILLTIIEKNSAFDTGMGALADGLSHIDYDNIVVSAMNNIPLSPDGTVEGLNDVNYSRIIKDAFASIPQVAADTDSVPDPTLYMNQLQEQVSELWTGDVALREQMNKQRQSLEISIAQTRGPSEQQQRLAQERFQLQRQAQFINNQLKKPEFLPVKKVLLDELAGIDVKLADLNKQIETLSIERRPYLDNVTRSFKAMRMLMDSIRSNEERIIELSSKMGYQSDMFRDPSLEIPEVPETPEAPEVFERLDRRLRAPRPPKVLRGTLAPPRPVAPLEPMMEYEVDLRSAPRTYKVIKGTVVKPAKPVVPARPKVSVNPAPTPKVAPAPTPKPVVAPIPPK